MVGSDNDLIGPRGDAAFAHADFQRVADQFAERQARVVLAGDYSTPSASIRDSGELIGQDAIAVVRHVDPFGIDADYGAGLRC